MRELRTKSRPVSPRRALPALATPVPAALIAAAALGLAVGSTAAPARAAAANPGGQAAPNDGTGAPSPTSPAPTVKKSPAPKPGVTKRRPAPVKRRARAALSLLDARCLGTSACLSDPHSVRSGGRLRLSGRGLKAGMTVVFASTVASAARSRTVGSRLRSTHHGLVVTVPAGAATGRIQVVALHGVRSNLFGPIHVLPVAARLGQPIAASPTGTAMDGVGMWIWYVNKSEGGDLNQIAARAHQAGATTLFIKSSDGSTNYWSQFSPQLIAALKAQGLRVCAWQYVYGTHPDGEAALGARAASTGADCLVIDAEAEYEGRYGAAQTYINDLRAAVGPNYPIALASFPYVDYHPQLPYSVFLGPGGAQFNAPQMYWKEIGTSVDRVYSHTYSFNRIYARPIEPLGQTYGGAPPTDIYRFRQSAQAYGASGLSFWDWQETTTDGWAAIGQALTPATDVVVSSDYPLLALNAKGDPVLWLQEHLASEQPSAPTTGVFDSATQSALAAFQTAHGLPPSGQADAATWQALLKLAPVAVDWTASGPGT